MTKYIVDVDQISPANALSVLMHKVTDLQGCKVGWGWSVTINGRRAFCRRTKTGYSIKEQRT